jgi:CysZ protein
MSWSSPVKSFSQGLKAYVIGVRWLKTHPRYLFYLGLPMALGVIFFVGALSLFAAYDETILALLSLTRTPEDPLWWDVLYYILRGLLYVSSFMLTILISFLMMNIVASPIYEVISWAVEKDFTGQEPEEVSWRVLFQVTVSEIKKTFFIILLSLFVLLIPGLNLLSTLMAVFLLAWDFFDYPLVRRGWTFSQRLGFVRGEFWTVLGLSVWMMIPFAQIITVPLAVAGATIINIEALQRQNKLTRRSDKPC